MKRARTFLRSEIQDAISLGAEHGMCVVLRPNGEIETFPAIHRAGRSNVIDMSAHSEGDKALMKWQAKHGGHG